MLQLWGHAIELLLLYRYSMLNHSLALLILNNHFAHEEILILSNKINILVSLIFGHTSLDLGRKSLCLVSLIVIWPSCEKMRLFHI